MEGSVGKSLQIPKYREWWESVPNQNISNLPSGLATSSSCAFWRQSERCLATSPSPGKCTLKNYDVSFVSPGLEFVLDTAWEGSLELFSKVCTRWPQEQVSNNKECCSWCALQWGPLKTYAFFICDLNHGTCMLPLCSGVPAVVSGSQCCQETLCSPSRSGGCPRQAKHFD